LWRLAWVLPIAALVGAAATSLVGAERPTAIRIVPAAAVWAALLAWAAVAGSTYGMTLGTSPSWKRSAARVADARAILARSRPGDLVLAPQPVSATLVIMSTRVTTVAPRSFYARALGGEPGQWRAARPGVRVLLQRFADSEVRPGKPRPSAGFVLRALRLLDVELACVGGSRPEAIRLLRRAGGEPIFETRRLRCFSAPGRASQADTAPLARDDLSGDAR
jgi:hypothetical protein